MLYALMSEASTTLASLLLLLDGVFLIDMFNVQKNSGLAVKFTKKVFNNSLFVWYLKMIRKAIETAF